MSEVTKVFKLLLNHEFFEKHKDTLPISSFDSIGADLLPTLEVMHDKFKKDITSEELALYHATINPAITTAQKNTFEAYIENIKSEPDIDTAIASDVYNSLWRREVGRFIAEYGTRLIDGDYTEVAELADYIGKTTHSLVPNNSVEPVDMDPIQLFGKLNAKGKWRINVPTLDRKIGNISPGTFVVLLARPESGKTLSLVHMIAAKDGFAAQGAKVLLLANEEGADRTAARACCCFNELPVEEVSANPSLGNTEAWNKLRKNMVFIHEPELSIAKLENYCKTYAPDIIMVDQLDHLSIAGNYEKTTDKAGALYRKARELASKYNCVIFAVSQASADGENRSKVTFSMAENSKTTKAATADIVIGICKIDDAAETEEGNCVIRHFYVSKNKISGWHGLAVVKMIKDQSRICP